MLNISYLNEDGMVQIWVLGEVPDKFFNEVIFTNVDGSKITIGMASEWHGVILSVSPDTDISNIIPEIERNINNILTKNSNAYGDYNEYCGDQHFEYNKYQSDNFTDYGDIDIYNFYINFNILDYDF